ncbi:MAG: hypothetical protein G01um10142_21 [Parcubacteria group bacterium Gr01-1014_2]|nr:MAG: hypothetical protein G01um10142_21 [Parcubacteria group bacterium Gr01-1014_2]
MNLALVPDYTVPQLPPGPTLTQGGLLDILNSIANFLIAAGIILAIITIVISGIMYFWAKSDTEAKSAKGWFRNGITGAFIILAVGVIILTIYNIVVTGSFFGGSGIPGNPILGGPGSLCNQDTNCQFGLECRAGLFGLGQKTCKP